MSLKSKLYFSPLGYVLHFIQVIFKFFGVGKFIIYGYYDSRARKFYRRCRIASTAIITDKVKLSLEDNIWINHYVRIDASGGVAIGEGCQIGYGSCILSHSSHIAIRLMGYRYMDYSLNERVGYITKRTTIGPYTFIGGGSYIMPGVTIGKGCVIGVNSVVTKDIPDYSIAIGSPARIIGSTKDVDKKYINIDLVRQNYYE